MAAQAQSEPHLPQPSMQVALKGRTLHFPLPVIPLHPLTPSRFQKPLLESKSRQIKGPPDETPTHTGHV
ncbi:hypothetical protein DC3_47220 [Deinococcus cellulosilyticus NBRC 106333 = KACC 11606]|uniref:Uncharacterized protein n=1 Tax=Deinococcus cellulosilyticus (strain DSM 18568 / NBRC 106333 / KACC 11606 / 5516J-15) TaxID=1223518 RepID=A0A511N967_DEIC1|nr:hypothetical protein DC3_47220 [Deinococcus cellulosilyticus NBRC 106333 = KACC 11606]